MFKKFLKGVVLSTLLLTGAMASGTRQIFGAINDKITKRQNEIKKLEGFEKEEYYKHSPVELESIKDRKKNILEEIEALKRRKTLIKIKIEEDKRAEYDPITLRIVDALKKGYFGLNDRIILDHESNEIQKLTKHDANNYVLVPFNPDIQAESLFASSPVTSSSSLNIDQECLYLNGSKPILIPFDEARKIEKILLFNDAGNIEYEEQELCETLDEQARNMKVVDKKKNSSSNSLSYDSPHSPFIAIDYYDLEKIFEALPDEWIVVLEPRIYGDTVRWRAILELVPLRPTPEQPFVDVYKVSFGEEDDNNIVDDFINMKRVKDYTIVFPHLKPPAPEEDSSGSDDPVKR
jgi:hypothetical protein